MFKVSKLAATSNSFLILFMEDPSLSQNVRQILSKWSRVDLVRNLCDRNDGIGADGFLFLEKSASADFKWDFYNQDGSSAKMCGNAARCAGLWGQRYSGSPKELSFETAAGLIRVGSLDKNKIYVNMPIAKTEATPVEIRLNSGKIRIQKINTGVPHALVKQESLTETDVLKQLAREIRGHEHFGAEGTNVTFIMEDRPDSASILTFERGVEDFTMACGTGAVAAAIAVGAKGHKNSIEITTPGGPLKVQMDQEFPVLIGEAHFIADCEIAAEQLGVTNWH